MATKNTRPSPFATSAEQKDARRAWAKQILTIIAINANPFENGSRLFTTVLMRSNSFTNAWLIIEHYGKKNEMRKIIFTTTRKRNNLDDKKEIINGSFGTFSC